MWKLTLELYSLIQTPVQWPFTELQLPALLTLKDRTQLTRTKQGTANIVATVAFSLVVYHLTMRVISFSFFFCFFLGGTFWSYYLDSCQPYSKAAHSTCPRQEAWPEDHPPSPTPWETSSRATWWAFGWVCGKGCGWGVDGLLLLAQRDNMIQTDVTTPITMQSGSHSHTRLLKQSVQNFTAQ